MDEGVEKVHPQGVKKVRVQSGPRRRPLFTPEELEEIRRADEELEALPVSQWERDASQRLDYELRGVNRGKTFEAQRAYREANREKIAEIGAALRRWRLARNLNQTELGELIGLKQRIISYWERGEVPIDFDRIRAKCPRVMEAFE